jgi:RNA polymerase sporulation-specific sigma factor
MVSKGNVKSENKTTLQGTLALVRDGDGQAFEALLLEYSPLLSAEVARHAAACNDQDTEDLRQVATLALYRAAMSFDAAQQEVEFGLYAKICISNALVSQLRLLHRHTAEISLPQDFFEGVTEDPACRVMEKEALDGLHARIKAVLSPYEHRVWTLYMAGFRSGEIAKRLGKPAHSVENAVYRIRQKLREALGDCL